MSVQYDRAQHLTLQQHTALQRDYDSQYKNPTTAFLLCYFLGAIGAHRLYLGQWGAAALRLLLPLIAAALAILGALDILSFATFSLAIIALLCALIWEALDLISLDAEVNAANAALMDHLLATSGPIPLAPQQPAPTPAPQVAQSEPVDTSATIVPPPVSAPAAPEPPTLTFEPDPSPPPPPQENAGNYSASTPPPTASAYVPPVAPEIVTGGFAAAPAEEPESPPVWPGMDAPTWPGGAEPQNTAQTEPDPLPVASPGAATTAAPQEPAPPQLKRIRVRRKITLDDGTVVGEQTLEDYFPAEMDTQEAAKILEARFQRMTTDEIARQANLPPGTDLELKRE
jgi:TM2 domain-containing membrane protein YozV